MFVDAVGGITASDQPEAVMCRELAEALGELWRTFGNAFDTYRPELTTCAVPGRNGVPSIRASSPRPRSAHDEFHAASNILTRVARRRLPNRASL
jgi:hypothetical protein